jgi:hypothetical protein
MLEGWATQQQARLLKAHTIEPRLRLVRRFAAFTNQYPWQWLSAEVEAFFADLRSGRRPISVSTARGYQTTLRLFTEYVCDARYGWTAICLEWLGAAPVQILHERNTAGHGPEHRVHIPVGRCRVRVSYVPSDPPGADMNPDEPGDYFRYCVEMWPATEPAGLVVVRQGPSPWAG